MSTIASSGSSKALPKLLSVFTEDELNMIADVALRARERSVERRSIQSVEIHFDEKGRARRVGSSDWVWFPAPAKHSFE